MNEIFTYIFKYLVAAFINSNTSTTYTTKHTNSSFPTIHLLLPSKPPTSKQQHSPSNFTFFRSTHNVARILRNVKIVYHARKVQQRRRSFTFMYVAVVGKRRFNGGFVRAKSFSVTAKSNKCLKILSIKRKKV